MAHSVHYQAIRYETLIDDFISRDAEAPMLDLDFDEEAPSINRPAIFDSRMGDWNNFLNHFTGA